MKINQKKVLNNKNAIWKYLNLNIWNKKIIKDK